MIVGIDVYHKTCLKTRCSIGAFVASINNDFSKFYSMIAKHKQGEELLK